LFPFEGAVTMPVSTAWTHTPSAFIEVPAGQPGEPDPQAVEKTVADNRRIPNQNRFIILTSFGVCMFGGGFTKLNECFTPTLQALRIESKLMETSEQVQYQDIANIKRRNGNRSSAFSVFGTAKAVAEAVGGGGGVMRVVFPSRCSEGLVPVLVPISTA